LRNVPHLIFRKLPIDNFPHSAIRIPQNTRAHSKHISSGGNLITILTNFGGYKTFRPRLTKYCRRYVPGIPGGVDAYEKD